MITAINQSQPQFRAVFNTKDTSILINEAMRAKNRRGSFVELTAILQNMKALEEKNASLVYRSGTPYQYNVLLDNRIDSKSSESFTDAIRRVVKKRLNGDLLKCDTSLSTKECIAAIKNLAVEA